MTRIASLTVLVLLLASCAKEQTVAALSFDSSPVISREQRVALVVDPYIALRDQPGDTGITVAHARRGEVYLVRGKRIVETAGTRVVWVSLENGWVIENSLQFYSSEARARSAGKSLQTVAPDTDSPDGIVW